MRIGYIEFRVYLMDAADKQIVEDAADQIQDEIVNFICEYDLCEPVTFTQDVTYEVRRFNNGENHSN